MRCRGPWTVNRIGRVARSLGRLASRAGAEVVLDASGVSALDTAGAWLLERTARALERGGHVVTVRLRPEHEGLLGMVRSVAVEDAPAAPGGGAGPLQGLGRRAWRAVRELERLTSFVGHTLVAAIRSLAGPLHVRWRQVLQNVQTAGLQALPTAALLAFFLGAVIAHQAASLFRPLGAGILVTDLVGLATLRDLAPMLTAIVVAARSGAAYSAEIGAMSITGEIDSLLGVGVSPIDVLVLPRIVALAITVPLLTVAADLLGVVGAMAVMWSELAIDPGQFLARAARAIQVSDYLVGLVKAPVFGAIVATVGCYQGLHARDNADDVGQRTAAAVVHSMFLVIIADASLGYLTRALGS